MLRTVSLTVLLLIAGCDLQPLKSQVAMPEYYLEGSFIIELTENAEPAELQAKTKSIAQNMGCDSSAPQSINWEVKSGVLPKELAQSFHVTFSGCDLTREDTYAIAQEIQDEPYVTSVEADAITQSVAFSESDTLKPSQYYFKKIARDEACETLPARNSKPVLIAVIDTGADADHSDLVNAFHRDANGKIIGANFVGKGANLPPDDNWQDKNGHGTHVAGVIAAEANNNKGIAGTAGCANVKIMPIRALNENGAGRVLEIDRAVQFAMENGAHVINLSLAFKMSFTTKQNTLKKSLYDVLARKGIMVFAAAGNQGIANGEKESESYTYMFPASFENVFAVTATNEAGTLASYSNYGAHVDLAAPGSNILSTYLDSYVRMTGTSMATPVATGVYALGLAAVIDNLTTSSIIQHDHLGDLFKKAVGSTSVLKQADVASGGIINARILVDEMLAHYSEKHKLLTLNQQQTEASGDLRFNNLSESQHLQNAVRPEITGWPQDTAAVQLYWGSAAEAFAVLDHRDLIQEQNKVQSQSPYFLYGSETLKAVAVDVAGNPLANTTVHLNGL